MEADFNPEFVSRMIPKLEWPELCQAAESVLYLLLFYSSIYHSEFH